VTRRSTQPLRGWSPPRIAEVRSPPLITLAAVAVLLHVWGNPQTLQRSVTFQTDVRFVAALIAVSVACVCLARPHRRGAMDALAVAMLLKTGVDLPVVSNHQLLLTLLLTCWLLARWRAAEPAGDHAFVTAARWTFLVAYAFAAVAKLNTGFLDVATSCASLLFGRATSLWLGTPVDVSSGWGLAAVAVTVVIELSVPVLLLHRRTRRVGVVVGALFHLGLIMDPPAHFFDFTAVVLLGLALFLPRQDVTVLGREDRREQGLSQRGLRDMRTVIAVVATALLTVDRVPPGTIWILAGLLLMGLTGAVIASSLTCPPAVRPVAAHPASARPGATWMAGEVPRSAGLRPAPLLVLPIVLALAIGISPYLEIRNGSAWNMYSNLAVADGISNHILIRRTLPLRDVLSDRVTILGAEGGGGYPRRAVLIQAVLDGPGTVIPIEDDHGRAVITHDRARAEVGAVALRLERLVPVTVGGPEPCRFAAVG
jgi:hypothetical protein